MLKNQIDLATMQVQAEKWGKDLVTKFLETWDGGLSYGGDRGLYDDNDEFGSGEIEGAGYTEEAEGETETDLQGENW